MLNIEMTPDSERKLKIYFLIAQYAWESEKLVVFLRKEKRMFEQA